MPQSQHDNDQITQDTESNLDILRSYGNPLEINGTQTANSSSTPSVEDEVASFHDKTLKEDAATQDHARDQKWKNAFSYAFILAFWILWGLFVLMCISLILHWILPEKCHWLTTDQLSKIETIIIAALASKAITNKVEKSH